MKDILLYADDLEESKFYLLNLEKFTYTVIGNSQETLVAGSAIEIFLKKEKTNILVALYSDGENYYFFFKNQKFNLINSDINANVKTKFWLKEFTLYSDNKQLLKFVYKYSDIQTDLLYALVEQLKDPLRDIYFKQMVTFYNTKNKDERLKLDQQNVAALRKARMQRRTNFSWLRKIREQLGK